jgi:hypothetical protein
MNGKRGRKFGQHVGVGIREFYNLRDMRNVANNVGRICPCVISLLQMSDVWCLSASFQLHEHVVRQSNYNYVEIKPTNDVLKSKYTK